MIVTNSTATPVSGSIVTETKATQGTNFEEVLTKNQQTKEANLESEKVEEPVDRMSYDFIKNTSIEEINEVYSDLPDEEIGKIKILHHIANMSDNDTLNKVIFDKAEGMNQREALDYWGRKASEQYHYQQTGSGQVYMNTQAMLNSQTDIKEGTLSHKEAFDFLLDMINSSKEGMATSEGELQDQYRETYNEYSDLLNQYNADLRKNITGSNSYV